MLLLFPFVVIGATLIGTETKSIPVILMLIALFLLIAFYYTVGNLTVIRFEEHLEFTWKKKLLFNYKEIHPVQCSSIHTLVIERGMLLKKIKTDQQDIPINNMKFFQGDVHRLIYELISVNKTKRVRTIDSWDEWKEKGYLKIAYRVNTGILAFALLAVVAQIIFKGYDLRQLLFMLLLIPQMFLYQLQMKGKLKQLEVTKCSSTAR